MELRVGSGWSVVRGDPRGGVDSLAVAVGREGVGWLRGLGLGVADRVFSAWSPEAGRSLVLYGAGPGLVALGGAGGRGEWFGNAERLRVAVAAAVRAARESGAARRLGVLVEPGLLEAAGGSGWGELWALEQAMVAADMANYVYSLRSRDAPRLLEEIVFGAPREAVERARAVGEAVRVARDIANAPPSRMNPDGLEEVARGLAERYGLSIRVLHRGELESLGMGGILAVGAGGGSEPRLIVLEYSGGPRKLTVVGKAVTFDAGGLDLKPPQYMLEMKFDKSGGAAAIGAVVAAAQLRLPFTVTALVPAVENMPDGKSYKPLDVIEMYNGLRVEIGNTDAEGRLIMADALAYAAERLKPDYMLDLATLTGAAVVALGNHAAALMGNSEELLSRVEEAAWRAGEPCWRLPMWPVYEKQLESKVADTSNVGGRPAGAITAAKFLEKFVGDTRWAHLDIAGVAWVQEKGPQKPYYAHGATGWGVRTVVELLRGLSR